MSAQAAPAPEVLELRVRVETLEKGADDREARLRVVEARLAWIGGGIAFLVFWVPIVVGVAAAALRRGT